MTNVSFVGEPLPEACPPTDASPFEEGTVVLRLVANAALVEQDFWPNSMLPNKHKPALADDCEWAALSVWHQETKREILRAIKALPKNRSLRYVAKVKVGPSAGVMKGTQHYSLWAFKNFSFISSAEPSMEEL